MNKGKNLMTSRLQTVDESKPTRPNLEHVEDAVLAAYVDNGLEQEDRATVSQHLSDCHWCFTQYAALKQELAVPVESALIAPFELVEAMKRAPEVKTAKSKKAEWTTLIDGVNAAFDQVLALRWPAPAMAFAVGVMLMVLLIPVGKTIIPLPGPGLAPDEVDGKIHSGFLDEDGASLYGSSVVQIPADLEGPVTFTWPAVEQVEGLYYNVDVSDGEGLSFGEYEIATNSWTIDISLFEPEKVLALTVMASIPDKGLMPVTTILVHRQKPSES